MMFINPPYKNCLLALALVFSVFGVLYLFGSQDGVIESFADRENSPEIIKNYRNAVEDTMLVSKYRKSYEDTIIELEDAISVAILSEVCQQAETIAKKPLEETPKIRKINELKAFKETLNDAMKTLDKK